MVTLTAEQAATLIEDFGIADPKTALADASNALEK